MEPTEKIPTEVRKLDYALPEERRSRPDAALKRSVAVTGIIIYAPLSVAFGGALVATFNSEEPIRPFVLVFISILGILCVRRTVIAVRQLIRGW